MQLLLNQLGAIEKQIETKTNLAEKEKLLKQERGTLIKIYKKLKIPLPERMRL